MGVASHLLSRGIDMIKDPRSSKYGGYIQGRPWDATAKFVFIYIYIYKLSHRSMVTKGNLIMDNHSKYAVHPKQNVFLFSSSFFLG